MNTNYSLLENLIEIYQTTQNEKKKRFAHLRIVELSMLLVKKIANTVNLKKEVQLEDIIQVGALGLVKAIENYKPNMNAKFSTYATHFIKGEIRHYLRDKSSIIRTPREMQDIMVKINISIKRLKEQGFEDPTNEQIAEESKLELSKITEALQTEYNKSPVSLDQSVFVEDDGDSSLLDKLPCGDYAEDISYFENQIMLKDAIAKLPEDLKSVVEMSYYNDLSQREISKILNISQMQVSRKLKKALNKLYEIIQFTESTDKEKK